jgi:hypothetical protein
MEDGQLVRGHSIVEGVVVFRDTLHNIKYQGMLFSNTEYTT